MQAPGKAFLQKLTVFFTILLLLGASRSLAEKPPEIKTLNSGKIREQLQQLQVLGRVLYIAAHPDDENNDFIAYLDKEKHYRTAYVSLTRGSGGQNILSGILGDPLGMVRTRELLEARRIDGGIQYFSNARDFGFSKSVDETLSFWDREKTLKDLVWTIRKFKPDVIITRFPDKVPETFPWDMHGHHTASAVLARKAYEVSGDPEKYPDQLEYTEPWKAERLMFNTSWWLYGSKEKFDKVDKTGWLRFPVGTYDPLPAESYTEMGARARSMHKSQGVGMTELPGEAYTWCKHLKGSKGDSLFDGISTSWTKVKNGTAIQKLLNSAEQEFDPDHPEKIVPVLLDARKIIKDISNDYWKEVKLRQLDKVIKSCMGLYMEATVEKATVARGDSLSVNMTLVNRSDIPLKFAGAELPLIGKKEEAEVKLDNNQKVQRKFKGVVSNKTRISHPYWLRKKHSEGRYKVADQRLKGKPYTVGKKKVKFRFLVKGDSVSYTMPVYYKKSSRIKGEVYDPLVVQPRIMVALDQENYLFPDKASGEVKVTVKAGMDNVKGELYLKVPEQWKKSPRKQHFSIKEKGAVKSFTFDVTPPADTSSGKIMAFAESKGEIYHRGLQLIDYDHIPRLSYFPEARSKAVRFHLKQRGKKIAYIEGSGDDVAESLRRVGYTVDVLQPSDLSVKKLKRYDACITGIRAYNTVPELKRVNKVLLDYVKEGGTLISQYNKSRNLVTGNIGPYPLTPADKRVTEEKAEVTFLNPEHPVMRKPNSITKADFKNWVQERGVYFPGEWDEKYTPLFKMHDQGEEPLKGSLLTAEYGKGRYIYTGLAFFRQLSAGVPGAYRLFANMIAYGN